MDEEMSYLLDQLIARQPRASTLSAREQQVIQQAIEDLRAGNGVKHRARNELREEFLRSRYGEGDGQPA